MDKELYTFSIVDLQSDQPIGHGLLFGVDHVNRQAMLGIFIGEKALWGQGYGQDKVGFGEIGRQRQARIIKKGPLTLSGPWRVIRLNPSV